MCTTALSHLVSLSLSHTVIHSCHIWNINMHAFVHTLVYLCIHVSDVHINTRVYVVFGRVV